MAYLWPINDDFHNNSSYCEKFRDIFFTEIFIVDKTCPRKDLIFDMPKGNAHQKRLNAAVLHKAALFSLNNVL